MGGGAVEFILETGEMLYIPRKWPHAAIALEPSLSLSTNFLSQSNKVGGTALDRKRDATSGILIMVYLCARLRGKSVR